MVQIGTIEYQAKVSGVAEAQANAEEFAQSNREVGESATESAAAVGGLAGALSTTATQSEDAADEATQLDERLTILKSTAATLGGAFGGIVAGQVGDGRDGGLGGILSGLGFGAGAGIGSKLIGKVKSGLGRLASWITGGSIVSYLSGKLAGASVGLGGAIAGGVTLGLGGVKLLDEIGFLDAVRNGAEDIGGDIPGWLRDAAILAPGPLAQLGGFITGFLDDVFKQDIPSSFRQGLDRAGDVGRVQTEAFKRLFDGVADKWQGMVATIRRTWDGAMGFVGRKANQAFGPIRRGINSINAEIGALADRVNSISGDSTRISTPNYTDDGDSSGGFLPILGPIGLPSLDVGGTVEETGIAEVHRGETIVPAGAGSGGGGGTMVDVDNINIEMSGDFDPSDASRRDIERLADRLVDAIGDKTNRRSGVR